MDGQLTIIEPDSPQAREALLMAERAWEVFKRRRIRLLLIALPLLLPAGVLATMIGRYHYGDPVPQWMKIAMAIFALSGMIPIVWMRLQIPRNPGIVRDMLARGHFTTHDLDRLRYLAGL